MNHKSHDKKLGNFLRFALSPLPYVLIFTLCTLLSAPFAYSADKLVVKDSGSNDVFTVDDTGKVYGKKLGIATLTPQSAFHISEQNGADPNRGIISSQHYDGTNAAVFNYKRSRGTAASPTALAEGDAIGAFHFWGYDGGSYHIVSSIRGMTKGTVGTNSVPSQLWFHTGTNSTDTLAAPRMIIDSTGSVGIATSSPTQKLDVNSDAIRIRNAKTPATSGDPCDGGEIAWDSSYVYVCVAANTWKRAGLGTW